MPGRPPIFFRLYLITDRRVVPGADLATAVDRALRGAPSGAVAVQLREKDLPAGELYELAADLRKITRSAGALLLVNDRADVAVACGADGVHLPVHGLGPKVARAIVGPDLLIGCSTHSVSEAEAARDGGADFVTFGPVYETPSKAHYGPAVGLSALGEASGRLSGFPVFALGGVTPDRAADCLKAGAFGVSAIRAVIGAVDPAGAANDMVRPFAQTSASAGK